jgi:hypothetical protein
MSLDADQVALQTFALLAKLVEGLGQKGVFSDTEINQLLTEASAAYQPNSRNRHRSPRPQDFLTVRNLTLSAYMSPFAPWNRVCQPP